MHVEKAERLGYEAAGEKDGECGFGEREEPVPPARRRTDDGGERRKVEKVRERDRREDGDGVEERAPVRETEDIFKNNLIHESNR